MKCVVMLKQFFNLMQVLTEYLNIYGDIFQIKGAVTE